MYIRCMIRTNIYITKQQQETLQQLSKKSGLSMAESVRRASDHYIIKLSIAAKLNKGGASK